MAIDLLGHTIKEGMTVITHYWIEGKKDIMLKVDTISGNYISLVDIETSTSGRQTTTFHTTHTLDRKADEVIVIDQQLEYNEKTFPENIL